MEWTRGPTIGRGSSAVVFLATTATGELFAVKSADANSCSSLLQNEECLISQLCSPFVVKCLGSDITWETGEKPVYNLFLEYVPGGALSDLIRKQGSFLDENVIRAYTNQMLKGLNYLHLKGMVHCDMKGQNILIGEDGLKIADFGCAKWAGCGSPAMAKFAGTPAYMAPEVARSEEQSFPADIWALGCTVIEMATGSNPWPEIKDPASALYRVAYSGDVPEIPSWFSDEGKDFLGKCLMRDSKRRWTAAELLQHPFMNSVEEIREFTGKSPTSVMDQRFWDAMEVSDSSPDPTDIASSSDSPACRIRALIGDAYALNLNLNLNFSDWTEEDDWVTVRGIETEECLELNEDCVAFLGIDEEEIQTSIAIEDSFFNSFTDEISNFYFSTFPVMLSDQSSKDDSVPRIVTFKTVAVEFFSQSDQFFFKSFSNFSTSFQAFYFISSSFSFKDPM